MERNRKRQSRKARSRNEKVQKFDSVITDSTYDGLCCTERSSTGLRNVPVGISLLIIASILIASILSSILWPEKEEGEVPPVTMKE